MIRLTINKTKMIRLVIFMRKATHKNIPAIKGKLKIRPTDKTEKLTAKSSENVDLNDGKFT